MPKIEFMRQSLVAIFDIEGFSERDPGEQANLVQNFVTEMELRLARLKAIQPDAFSTGDGAIVSIGRRMLLDVDTVVAFLDFVVEFSSHLLQQGIIIRTAVNYADLDRAVVLDEGSLLKGEYIQVGDTINNAARIITFCEPREVLFSESVVQLLRGLDLSSRYPLFQNEDFVTKHQQTIRTFTYDPPETQAQVFYSPHCAMHPYKRYSSFPPIKTETFQYFMENGLERELKKVITTAYDALFHVNQTMTFLSWHSVIQVLTTLNYDPDDEVYVLSRNDQPGFWTQGRRESYIRYLRAHAGRGGPKSNQPAANAEKKPYINQKRVLVYQGEHTPINPEDGALLEDLRDLHATNSLFNFPGAQLAVQFEALAELRYGFTLSKKHGYAIIPVPGPESVEPQHISPNQIGDLLRQYPNYDPIDGPMKAIITAQPVYITRLISEMDKLMNDPLANLLK
ncbi:MAG: hypothetical protein ABIQ09_09955 [Jatrophihabitantaceae bacterium]